MTRLYTGLLLFFGALWFLAADLPGPNPQGSAHAAASPPLTSAPSEVGADTAEASVSLLLGVLGFSGLALFNLRLRRGELAKSASSARSVQR